MELLYYLRQWPGSRWHNLLRLLHVGLLEAKRIIGGTKYIAEFDLTDNCNLNCPHCYHFRQTSPLTYTELPVDVWAKKFIELRRQGIRRILLIGGEPALRQDIITEAVKIFRYVDICTNGTIKINGHKNQKLFVSIDGIEATHDHIRGEGVFALVLANYRNDKRVVLSMTVTAANYRQMEDVVHIAKHNGLLGVSFDIYTPAPLSEGTDAYFVDKQTRGLIISEMHRLKKKYPDSFLMSYKAIRWFADENHHGQPCYWRQAVKHFDVNLAERPSCKELDCRHCGHFAQANLSPLNRYL